MRRTKLSAALILSAMVSAGGAQPPGKSLSSDAVSRFEAGNSTYKKGRACAWTGLALLPVALVAAIPVWNDGAFGITAADPGFALAIAAGGLGLIHVGIPLMGLGADRMEAASRAPTAGMPGKAEAGWARYRQSWLFLGTGALVLAAAVPIGAVAALEWDRPDSPLDYTATGLAWTGAGLISVGAIEQYVGWRNFSESRRQSLADAPPGLGVSLQPMLRRTGSGGLGMGLRLACMF